MSAVRRILGSLLAAAMVSAALAPAAAQAAAPRSRPAILWSQPRVERTIYRGHESVITAHFLIPYLIRHAVFAIHVDGVAYARPNMVSWGTVLPNRWYSLPFVVGVPSGARGGRYVGAVRLVRWEGPHDLDGIGTPLRIVIHVPAARAMPLLTWTPAGLGTVAVQQGQTVTETASFVSDLALSDVQIKRQLNSYPATHGVAISVVSMSPAVSNIAAGTLVSVMFTVSAAANAPRAVYAAALYVVASHNGPAVRLGRDLPFNIRVQGPEPLISWMPAGLGTITILQGQTMTETASFTSSAPLAGSQIVASIPSFATTHGVAITVVSTNPATTSIPAGTAVSVTFTIAAAPNATPAVYSANLHLMGSVNGGAVTRLWHELGFRVDVDRVNTGAIVSWTPGSPASYPSITRSGTATVSAAETASFSTNVALTNASLAGALNGVAAAQGITLSVSPLASTSIAANTTVAVSFTINVPATARRGVYAGDLWLVGQAPSSAAPLRLGRALHFVFAVN